MTEATIFAAALEKAELADREAYLAEACAGDLQLRRRVEALLRAHAEPDAVLGPPPRPGVRTAEYVPIAEKPGSRVGPYKLMEQIGEGGFGLVFVAEQQEPVKRKVALKVIKPGMDSAQVIARFEAERQALAMMDHPNIAKVLDAGATESGRPYFVMELVRGIPITEYCDQNQLSPRERLDLFVSVCNAIQHAHQKGVIHRDIKPSNVLVTSHDGKPVVKVIDFGVAKAINQHLTERTIYTNFAQMIGTPLYMSPEQAEMSGLDIDTRSDIYSLGVLLYELLTGTTPLEKKRFAKAAYDEIRRVIREEEPPRPSQRLSSSDTLPSVAACRKTEPAKLSKMLRGEVDWIVMKALEKDRTRRYEAASGLARDIERFLHDEAVEACPPSARYRLKKFARKHRAALTTTAAIALLLLLGVAISTWLAVRARRAEAEARRERDEAEAARQAEAEQRKAAEVNERKAKAAAEAENAARQTAQTREAETKAVLDFVESKVFAAARPEGQSGGLGRDVTLRRAVEAALPFVENSFVGQPLIEARLRTVLGFSFQYLGEAQAAAEQLRAAQMLYTKHRGANHPETLISMSNLATSYSNLGRHSEAARLREETLALQRGTLGPNHVETILSMNNLANSYQHLGRYADALKLREETLQLSTAHLGPDNRITILAMSNLASSYSNAGRHREGLELQKKVVAARKLHLGPKHPDTLRSIHLLGGAFVTLGRPADALPLLQETLKVQQIQLGPNHPDTLDTMYNMAGTYLDLGQCADAVALCEEALPLHKATLGADHPRTLAIMALLAVGYQRTNRHADCLRLSEETYALREKRLGPDHPDALMSKVNLASALVDCGREDEGINMADDCIKRAGGRNVTPRIVTLAMTIRLRHFEKAKDAAGCRLTAEMWEALNRTDADSLCTAACMRAVTAAVIQADPRTPAADADRLAKVEADRAMTWLARAAAAGYNKVAALKQDRDLEVLRERDDFKKLVAEMESRADTN